MNIHFHLDYNTYYGQDLILNVIKGYHNGEKETTEYRMHTTDGYHWDCLLYTSPSPRDS